MCFKTYAIKKEFDAKTKWTDRKKFYARCNGFDGGARPCKWYISARRQPDGATIRVNQIPHVHTCITSSQNVTSMTSQTWVAEKITLILAKTPNTIAMTWGYHAKSLGGHPRVSWEERRWRAGSIGWLTIKDLPRFGPSL